MKTLPSSSTEQGVTSEVPLPHPKFSLIATTISAGQRCSALTPPPPPHTHTHTHLKEQPPKLISTPNLGLTQQTEIQKSVLPSLENIRVYNRVYNESSEGMFVCYQHPPSLRLQLNPESRMNDIL